MQFKRAHLQNFRNISLQRLSLNPSCFFLGPNAQGKTSLIEALALVTALRSFRTQETKLLIQHGEPLATLLYFIEHEEHGECELIFTLSPQQKKVELNEQKITRFSDLMGLFPTVVLSSEDIQLLRGTPSLRRRFIDLTLATTDKTYLNALRTYHRALQERNALLRYENPDSKLLTSFDTLLAQEAYILYQKRRKGLATLENALQSAYAAVSPQGEVPHLCYKPDVSPESEVDLTTLLTQNYEKDRLFKSTQRGPHRDDFLFKINAKAAREFASEGQQRTLVLALRLAQMHYYHQKLGVKPVVLADDILGQLDPSRSTKFWESLPPEIQVIATGTTPPPSQTKRNWHTYTVLEGTFNPELHIQHA